MSVFPFIAPELLAPELLDEQALPMFREYAYDFEHNELLLKNGQTYLAEGDEALKIWIYFALRTPRFRHIAYSRAYGSEHHTLLGQPLQEDIQLAELQRFTVECLMVNPYIQSVEEFTFEVTGSRVAMHFLCQTEYGELPYTHEYDPEEVS